MIKCTVVVFFLMKIKKIKSIKSNLVLLKENLIILKDNKNLFITTSIAH